MSVERLKKENGINTYFAHSTTFGALTASEGVSVLYYLDKSGINLPLLEIWKIRCS